jgi:type I restriction enzyme, S subunit
LKKYSQINNSGIQWIEKIPKHWKVERIKYRVKINEKTLDDKTDPNLEILYIDVGSVHAGGKIDEPEKMSFKDAPSRARRIINQNDTIVSTVRTYLKAIAFIDETKRNCICSTGFVVISSDSIDPKFLYLSLTSQHFVDTIEANSKGVAYPAINPPQLGNLKISFPPTKTEQKQIVSYLDEKTKKIDSEIIKNQNLIKLLREKRQSEINRTITKGLNDSVTMNDSGIPWIGEIPKEWNINKIKFTSYVKGRIGYHGLRSDEFIDSGPYLITGTDFSDGGINWNSCYHVPEWRYEQNPLIQIKNKDILITKDGTIGKVAFIDHLPGKTTLNSHLLVLRPLKNYYVPKFLYWIFLGDYFKDYFNLVQSGSIMDSISQEKVENFVFAFPSETEQKQIVSYLDKKTAKMDSLISKIELQITNLQEFRESLISSVVTGKIKVTQA